MNDYIKEIKVAKARAAEPTDQEWGLIQKQMLRPDMFERKDIIVFEPYLANNFKDRDEERFPLPVLKRFQKTLIGRSVLADHDRKMRDGKVFDIKLEKTGIGETVELVGESIYPDFTKHLQTIEKIDNGIFWLVPKYFMLNVTEDEQASIRKIASGIDGYVSIGFSAPSIIPYKDEKNGNVLWWEYVSTKERQVEATEMSRVFLGAQLGAGHKENKKQMGVKKMEIILKSLGDYKLVISDADVNQEWVKSLDSKIQTVIDKSTEEKTEYLEMAEDVEKQLKDVNEVLESVRKVLGVEKIDIEKIKSMIENAKENETVAKAYVESLQKHYLQMGREMELLEPEDIESEKLTLSMLSIGDLERFVSRYEKLYEQKFPGKGQIGEKPNENEPVKVSQDDEDKYNVI